jgi:hypothetical protein
VSDRLVSLEGRRGDGFAVNRADRSLLSAYTMMTFRRNRLRVKGLS